MLSENLKRIREEKGYSKMKLAKITGLSRKTIEFIENRTRNDTKIGTIEKLAKGLDVSINELIK